MRPLLLLLLFLLPLPFFPPTCISRDVCFATPLTCDANAMRCDAMRCDSMGCNTTRCNVTRTRRRSQCAPTQPAIRSLAIGGRYLVVGFASGTIPSPPLNLVLLKESCVVGVFWGAWRARRPEERCTPGSRMPRRAEESEELIACFRARFVTLALDCRNDPTPIPSGPSDCPQNLHATL